MIIAGVSQTDPIPLEQFMQAISSLADPNN
jgi:hypothetical protein